MDIKALDSSCQIPPHPLIHGLGAIENEIFFQNSFEVSYILDAKALKTAPVKLVPSLFMGGGAIEIVVILQKSFGVSNI